MLTHLLNLFIVVKRIFDCHHFKWVTIFVEIMQVGVSLQLCRWYFLQFIMHMAIFIVIMQVTVSVVAMYATVSSKNFILLSLTDIHFS